MPPCAGGVRPIAEKPTPTPKKKKRLQQRLDVYWILHNFVRVHFTTQHVPAVALGIIEQGLSLAEIFSYPHAFGIKRNQCRYLKSGLKKGPLPHRLRVHSHTLPLISSQP
jgi:hypothetical protein